LHGIYKTRSGPGVSAILLIEELGIKEFIVIYLLNSPIQEFLNPSIPESLNS
jgi:hypothetical protein